MRLCNSEGAFHYNARFVITFISLDPRMNVITRLLYSRVRVRVRVNVWLSVCGL